MSVEDLVVRLRIEDDNKLAHKNTYISDSAKAYMVEHAASSLKSNPKGKDNDKGKISKGCATTVTSRVIILQTARYRSSNNNDWWVDIVATRHVCADKRDVILKMISGKELKLTNTEGLPKTIGISACLAEKVMTRFPRYKSCWETHAKNQQDEQGTRYAPEMFEPQKDDEQFDHEGSHQRFSRVRKDECAKAMAKRSHQNGTLL
ncbi:hypothetical protein Tco_0908949 [Tanacetum coccineum]|uniref:Uncharacterized protein n=1 Tax=Tanacetum coccineum TaxID=301880 RepID=A0ABQ5CVU6_9ASTR